MPDIGREDANRPWVTSTARVIGCKRTISTSFVDDSSATDDNPYPIAEYVVSISYEVQGKLLYSRYKSGVPRENGYSFEILYDPEKPERNTASEDPENGWMNWKNWPAWKTCCIVALGTALTLLIIFFQKKMGWPE